MLWRRVSVEPYVLDMLITRIFISGFIFQVTELQLGLALINIHGNTEDHLFGTTYLHHYSQHLLYQYLKKTFERLELAKISLLCFQYLTVF